MSNPNLEKSISTSDIVAISDIAVAAQERQVSERTIYRMLKKGKLRRVKNVNSVVTNSAFHVTDETIKELVSEKCDENYVKISDKVTQQIQQQVEAALGSRDRMIESLLARERELIESNDRLQAQLLEMADLLATQNQRPVISPENKVAKLPLSMRIRRWLIGKRDKSQRAQDKAED